MADFVAVIRRTVDGLSDNVPEMRSKVYEKARGAVRRQLENMKPRPSDELIDRQMQKLEAAISEVESDYAEALPSLDDVAEEPTAHDAAPVEEAQQPAAEEPAPEEHALEERVAEPEPAVEEPAEQVAEAEPEHDEPEPAQELVSQQPDDEQPQQSEPEAVAEEREPVEEVLEQPEEPVAEPEASDEHREEQSFESRPIYAEEAPDVESPVDEQPVEDEQAAEVVDAWEEQAAEVAPAEPAEEPEEEKPAAGSEWELPEWHDPAPAKASATPEPVWTESVDIDADGKVIDLAAYMPPETPSNDDGAKVSVEPSHSWEWDESDPFQQPTTPAAAESSEPAISDWSWPVEKPASVETATPAVPAAHWDDIDRLLDRNETADDGEPPRATVPDPEEMAAPARPISYRVEPKRSRSGLKLAGIGVILLALLGGGGYGYWLKRDDLNAWVSKTIASVTASAPKTSTTETSQPAAETPSTTPATTEQSQGEAAGNTKFTQRLQADGTETDPGPAQPATGEVAQAEGKSVAAQTEAGTAQATTQTPVTSTDQAAGTTTPPATNTTTPAAQNNVQVPEGAQKMFLYEERLGQSAPTAIEGSVAWSLKEESPGDGAPPEPAVQAQISVPERGLTALMTLKRNTDPSLPASHVVEFVFSLPENFEGGAIENVQRVSMKRTEQDRGDPLIAVPAKITDDFHMIALNDYPEAVATNTELLRSRSWIDIPITYRNGRRALLTLEKGPAGTEAFTKALQAWSLAKPNTSQ
ncbi:MULTISPECIES: hypothetical protein [unclassified Rhizobium]|uniref:hypothetical protein n=1 Tax=unclassified Rhizobium TaxID=2613769 RepID=UPI0006F926C5|nr:MULTISPECIES: hypothetical protein [unclassified Rhizobium]KQV35148.1 hypothetical protein ASC86_13125 [Rhizobium sp. Root1212]KRD24953.1 hypothetical protein ASE37_13120 [Rhizobium sp. Root268]